MPGHDEESDNGLRGPGGVCHVDLRRDESEGEKRIGDFLLAGEDFRGELINAVFLPGEPGFQDRHGQADAGGNIGRGLGDVIGLPGLLLTLMAAFKASGCCDEKSLVEE